MRYYDKHPAGEKFDFSPFNQFHNLVHGKILMHVYVFAGQGSVVAYSGDLTGGNLPQRFAPWTMTQALEMSAGETERPSVDTDACLADIERVGYHLTERSLRITADQDEVRVSAPVRRNSA